MDLKKSSLINGGYYMTIIAEFKTEVYKVETYETKKIEIESNCLFFKDSDKFSCCLSLEELNKVTIEQE